MKKLIVILLAMLILTVALAACTPNDNGDRNESTSKSTTAVPSTTKNEGMITDTGTGTNIIDRLESDIIGTTNTTATK
jgi:uncharacterized protein YdeI (BOF family)